MEEIPSRVHNIEIAITGKMGINEVASEEFCYLQIRIICELVALAALVAHGNIQSAQSLRREWSASKIMKRLEQINSDFFPSPCVQDTNKVNFEFKKGQINKDEFLDIYGKSGDKLHRGSIHKIITHKHAVDFNIISENVKKIMGLITLHLIFLNDRKTAIIFNMQEDDGSMRAYIAKKQETHAVIKR